MTRSVQEAQVGAPPDDKKEEIVSLGPWFHNLHLPDGSQTAPRHSLGDSSIQVAETRAVYSDTLDHDIEERNALRNPGWPGMAFIEHRFANDPTNRWVPNHAGIEAMLRSSGMVVRAHLGHEIYLCEPAPPGTPRSYDFTPELRSATGRRWR